MLLTEWNWDDAKKVWDLESREDERETIARNSMAVGLPYETIQTITGLDIETIMSLATGARA